MYNNRQRGDDAKGLAGRTMLITGASRGIGAATARIAHRESATVVIHFGANRAAAGYLSAELGDERVHIVGGDLTHAGAAQRIGDDAEAAAGRIDVLVNNAGAWICSPLDDGDDSW